jgi:hypothetical protein
MYWIVPNWRRHARNIGLACFSAYMLNLTMPKKAHFERYVEQRVRYEPEFAMRMEHPQTEVTYEDMFLFAKVHVESCSFRKQNESPYGSSLGKSRWVYYGILNNFWFETQTL